ncbi:MAG: M3 family metallopeptidase [Myxococcota bacterium]
MTDPNPLLDPRGLPHFASIESGHVMPAVEAVLERNRRELDRALRSDPPGPELLEVVFDGDERLHRAWGPVRHLHAVRDAPALRREFNLARTAVTAWSSERSHDPRLLRAYRALVSRAGRSTAETRFLRGEICQLRLEGAELGPADQRRYAQIRRELSALSSRFSEQLLDATDAGAIELSDPDELAGLPASVVEAAARLAGRPDRWRFSLQQPSLQPFLTHAQRRERREEIYRAYFTRASSGPLDNTPVIERILELRSEAARLLGFDSWAARTLERRMAHSPEDVESFLLDLAHRTRPHAERELEELRDFASDAGAPGELEAWDLPFWSERLREREYGFSEETLRAYLPLPAALEGLFAMALRLYGIRVEPREGVETWDPAVRYLDVRDESGEARGGLYLDLYARPHKRGGAWMDSARERRRRGPHQELPVAYLVCNFAAPTPDAPARLTQREVATLFHEFGHTLHHVLTRVEVPGVAGLRGVEWDAVEFPSQLHENWAWEPESLGSFARHHRSGEPMPARLLEQVHASRHFQAGLQMLRQLEFALFDLRLHTRFEPGGRQSVQECLEEVRREVAVVTPPSWSRFQNGFAHIFSGGYAAGYYAYKWAEVMAADAFSRFASEGLFNRETGRDLARCVLERGGSDDPAALFEAFRGRPAQVDALLRQCGLEG